MTEVIGCVEVLAHGVLSGWCLRKQHTERLTCELAIEIDGEIFRVPADRHRSDLLNRGWPIADCGFRFFIPERFFDDRTHTLRITVVETTVYLQVPDDFLFRSVDKYHGALESVAGGVVYGWIINHSNQEEEVSFELLVDGHEAGNFVANLPRSDLTTAEYSSIRHGFRCKIPAKYFDDEEHALKIRIGEHLVPLVGSPYKAFLDSADRNAAFINPDTALLGKDGWLFLCNDSNNCLAQYQGKLRLSEEKLSRWKTILLARQTYFHEKETAYLFCIVPGKEMIYGEYLPNGITPSTAGFPTDQFLSIAHLQTSTYVLDFRPFLLTKKPEYKLYSKNDTHWNIRAGHVAALAINRYLLKLGIPINDISQIDFRFYSKSIVHDLQNLYHGDLAFKNQHEFHPGQGIVPRSEQLPVQPEEVPYLESTCIHYDLDSIPDWYAKTSAFPTVITRNKSFLGPKAVLFRDSFSLYLIPFLSTMFERVVYIWSADIIKPIIEREQPTVVISQTVDRFLLRPPLE